MSSFQPPVMFPDNAEWKVVWDGEVITSQSAYDVLALVGERSYNPMDHKHPKRGIAYRVFMQYRVLIDDELSDAHFLATLAEYGIIELSVKGVRPPDVLQEALEFSQAWYAPNGSPDVPQGGEE